MTNVNWPAVLKYAGDSELVYVSGEQAWAEDTDLHALGYQEEDVLIDSKGMLFVPQALASQQAALIPTGRQLTLTEMLSYVQLHQSCSGFCCAAKSNFATIEETVRALDEMA